MKKLCALIAVLSLMPFAYAHADGSQITASGNYRLQYQDMQNSAGDKSADSSNFHQRFRLGVNARPNERFNAHVTLVGNDDWGAPQYADSAMTELNANTQNNLNNSLLVNEAYASWVINDSWMMRFGRGAFTMGDGRLISKNKWENVETAFDGVVLSWDQDWGRTSFFAVKGAVGYTPGTILPASVNPNLTSRFYGVSEDLKNLPTFLKMVNIHLLEVYQDQAEYQLYPNVINGAPALNETRAGLAVSGDKMNVDYRVDYEMETGKYTEYSAVVANPKQNLSTHMIDADLGYTMPSLMSGRVHIGYHQDSGNGSATDLDGTYNGFAYNRHANGGLMGIFGWGNLTYTWFGVSAQPRDDINVAVNYYMFSKTNSSGVVNPGDFGNSFSTDGGVSTVNGTLGNELDLRVTKKYGHNFFVAARYGMFSAGSGYNGVNASGTTNSLHTTVSEYYLAGCLKF